jgi:hypothetical protein
MRGPIGPNDVRESGLVIHRDERGWVSQIQVQGRTVEARGNSEEEVEAGMLAALTSRATAAGVMPRLTADRTIPQLRQRLEGAP